MVAMMVVAETMERGAMVADVVAGAMAEVAMEGAAKVVWGSEVVKMVVARAEGGLAGVMWAERKGVAGKELVAATVAEVMEVVEAAVMMAVAAQAVVA